MQHAAARMGEGACWPNDADDPNNGESKKRKKDTQPQRQCEVSLPGAAACLAAAATCL